MNNFIYSREPSHREEKTVKRSTYRHLEFNKKPSSIDVGTERRGEVYDALIPRISSDRNLHLRSDSSLFKSDFKNTHNRLKSAEFDCVRNQNVFEQNPIPYNDSQNGNFLSK